MSFAIEPSSEISHRVDLVLLVNARGYVDAVEVGTDQGVFAAEFLRRFEGNWLFCVDPYQPVEEFPFDRMGDLATAVAALTPYHGRFRIVRGRSPECIPFVRSHISPEFVYVDGAHDEASVYADLAAWWEVIPDHGMIGGHDYDDAHPGVKAAVERFARERKVVVRLTAETEAPPSFYIYRREPETLFTRYYRAAEEPNPRAAR